MKALFICNHQEFEEVIYNVTSANDIRGSDEQEKFLYAAVECAAKYVGANAEYNGERVIFDGNIQELVDAIQAKFKYGIQIENNGKGWELTVATKSLADAEGKPSKGFHYEE